jgi:CDP-6-deoxy-D-xylo-4-hexulose-3-dehydrase
MISTDDAELIKIVRSLSWWGRDCYCVGAANLLPCGTCGKRFDKWIESCDAVIDHKYVFTNMGYNLKPLDLQGAIGLAQLEKFPDIDVRRRNNKDFIAKLFEGNLAVRVAQQLPLAEPCWFGVPLICGTAFAKEDLVRFLENNKIQTRSYFAGNILLHSAYKHLANADDFPYANEVLSRVLFLGCPPQYSPEILNYIAKVVAKWTA